MSTTQHPLTETAAAEIWDANGARALSPWGVLARAFPSSGPARLAILRAAFDAGREHEREHAAQHPLTDETRDRLVSYISGGTIDCSSEEGRYDSLSEDDARTLVESLWEPMMQAVQAAALAVTTPTDPHHDPRLWEQLNGRPLCAGDEVRQEWYGVTRSGIVDSVDGNGDPWTAEGGYIGPILGGTWYARRAAPTATPTTEKETPMAEPTTTAEPLARTLLAVPEGYGAPHHNADRIKADDYVMQVDRDGFFIRAGIAHRQDQDGDWQAKDGKLITWATCRADRPDAVTVWPAPTPPAEEVELPGEPCVLTDAQLREALVAGLALWTGREVVVTGFDRLAAVYPVSDLTAFTLPDGTRARRDGERPNGEPRFVKEGEEA